MRKASHEHLATRATASSYNPSQYAEAILVSLGIVQEPSEWEAHIKRASASFTMKLMYGSDSESTGDGKRMENVGMESATDERVEKINDFVGRLTSALLPGAFLVEFFPWMMYFPSWFVCSPMTI